MARREFDVPKKGIGKPDFYQKAAPSRPILGTDQRQWFGLWTGSVGALSQAIIPLYAGVKGWQLYFAGGWVFCDADVVQSAQIDIERPPLPFLPIIVFGYKIQAESFWHDPAVVLIGENQKMRLLLNNIDIEAEHNYYVSFMGMEEKI